MIDKQTRAALKAVIVQTDGLMRRTGGPCPLCRGPGPGAHSNDCAVTLARAAIEHADGAPDWLPKSQWRATRNP